MGDLLVKASDMATPGSDAFKAFTSTMAAENLEVSNLEITTAPRAYEATVVMSQSGDIMTPAPTEVATTTVVAQVDPDAEGEEEGGSSNAGAIIGAVIGAVVGIGLCIGLVVFLKRKGKS